MLIPSTDAFHCAGLPVKARDLYKFDIKWEHYRIWKIIGTELGIDVETLNAIEKDHTDNEDCLHVMIDRANPAPTHEAIAEVLQSAHINNAIAGIIISIVLQTIPQSNFSYQNNYWDRDYTFFSVVKASCDLVCVPKCEPSSDHVVCMAAQS